MRRLLMLPLAFLLMAQAPARPTTTTLRADAPIACDSCPGWNAPREPFKVFGDTYFVGPMGLSSIVIAGDQGLVLIDGALPQSAPLIDANITRLGLRTTDIKLILASHAHFDHVGGVHALQAFTGATVATSEATARALALGHPTPDDPQYDEPPQARDFPQLTDHVRVVKDGETVRVGTIAVTAHYTPGHTPGATSWTWQSCEGTRCLNIVYAESLSAVSSPGFKFTGDSTHPSLVDSFRRSIRTIAELPCDILLSTHPFVTGMDEKLARRSQAHGTNPLVDAGACRTYAESAMRGLDARVKEERGF